MRSHKLKKFHPNFHHTFWFENDFVVNNSGKSSWMLVSFLLRPASCLGFCLNIIANYFNLGPIPRMISDRKLNIILIYHKICRKNFKFRLFLQNIIWQCQKQCNFTFWKILSVPRQCNLKFCQCQGSKPSGNPGRKREWMSVADF